jgi:hypothetical protein
MSPLKASDIFKKNESSNNFKKKMKNKLSTIDKIVEDRKKKF